MTAEEFLNKKYSGLNDWKFYPPSEKRVVEIMEAYLKQEVEAITDEEILECVKHSDNGITVYRDGVSSIRNFKNKLLI